VAVVTGASSGIGRAVAFRLARRGVRVALVARTRPALEVVAAAILSRGVHARVYPCDVADPAAVLAAHGLIVEELGSADILVNAAGFGVWKPFAEVTVEEHAAMMARLVSRLG